MSGLATFRRSLPTVLRKRFSACLVIRNVYFLLFSIAFFHVFAGDIWSIGCIFAEFFLHSRLFPESGNHWQTICGVLGVKEELATDAANNNDLLKSVSAEASLDLSDTLFPPNRPEFGLTGQ